VAYLLPALPPSNPSGRQGRFPEDTHAAHPAAESNFLLDKIRKGLNEYALIDCGHPAKTSAGAKFAAVPSSFRLNTGAQFALFRSVAFPSTKAD
jgi:hypothetical protein